MIFDFVFWKSRELRGAHCAGRGLTSKQREDWIRAKESGWKQSCRGFPGARDRSRNGRGCAGGGDRDREPRDPVPAKGSAPCSYSGYTAVTGHWETRPQQVLAAKLSRSWLSLRTDRVCSPGPRRDLGGPGPRGDGPPQYLGMHFCADPLLTFQSNSEAFGRHGPNVCLLSSGPKLLAGVLKFGNELKAELWGISRFCGYQRGKARQTPCSGRRGVGSP